MKHQELINHMEGSYLKKQFLEAFLTQSAYIESLLKLYSDFKFYEILEKYSADHDDYMFETISGDIGQYGFFQITEFLYKSKLITNDQKKTLDNYRKHRNKIMHDLIKESWDINFEDKLMDTYDKGNKIIKNKKFQEMITAIEKVPDIIEELKQTEEVKK